MSFVAVGLYLALWMASPQPVAVQRAADPDAQVAGRVVDAISRAPVAGATVLLMPLIQLLSSPPPRGTITDADGNFIFHRLGPGRYRIDAQKPGVAWSTAQTIDVTASQSVTDVELALQPGAVIAGRIVDANGGPVSDVAVEALRQQTGPDGQAPATTPPQTAHTNDRGEFRLEGLDEGSYLLLAAPLSPRPVAPPTAPALVLAHTYYPGTPNKETAEAVTVVSGQALDHLQFSMLMLPAHEVSGVVVNEAGAPVAGVFVVLTADSTTGGPGRPATGETDPNGAFRFGGIVSGTYRLMAETRGRRVARSGPSPSAGVDAIGPAFLGESGPRQIAVRDTDITGLRLVLPAIPAGPAKPITGPVKPTVEFETAKIIGLTMLPDVRAIKVGNTVVFEMQVQMSPGVPSPGGAPPPPDVPQGPLWETNTRAVAVVTRGGSLTALAPGEVTLTVRYRGMSATRVLRIIP
jgi:hypothetical protein